MIGSPLEDIEAAALRLTPTERVRLAERLLASLDERDEILASWVAEAERRGEAYERGEMEAIDFDESIANLKARLAAAAGDEEIACRITQLDAGEVESISAEQVIAELRFLLASYQRKR